MRELETSLQQFGEFLLRARVVKEGAAPHCGRWVRRFLTRPVSDEPLAERARRFCEDLERSGRCQDWQVQQAEQAVRIYFLNFLGRTDWRGQPARATVDERERADPLAVLDELRRRLRTRHYSYRTECSYADWVRRFLAYLSERQGLPHPRVESSAVRDYLTHLAVRQKVSASTQNQAFCAILFLCRQVLGIDVEGLSNVARANRGSHLPVVLSVPETAALAGAMSGTTWLMAALIYGGGLRVSECCELRIKDLDFDQGLILVRAARAPRTARRSWRRRGETSCGLSSGTRKPFTGPTGLPDSPACGCPTRSSGSFRTPVASWAGSGCSRAARCRPTPASGSCADTTSMNR
jgi:hypothetical protein